MRREAQKASQEVCCLQQIVPPAEAQKMVEKVPKQERCARRPSILTTRQREGERKSSCVRGKDRDASVNLGSVSAQEARKK